MKYFLFFSSLYLLFSGCCGELDDLFTESITCRDEVFTETKKVPLKFDYIVNTNKKFIIAQTITSDKIRKALSVPESNFTLKQIEITSGKISYKREADNQALALFTNFAVVGNTFNQILLFKKDELLPLYDIIDPTGINKDIKLNEFFDSEAIKGLKDILRDYVLLINDDGISVILLGEPSPFSLSPLAHFTLNFSLNITIVYEVCRYVPMGEGERICE